MRKNPVVSFILFGLIMVLSACGGKYDEVVEVNNEVADATEAYITSLSKADNAASVAAAVDKFAEKMEELTPRMKEIADKYPELKDPNNYPEELKAARERSDAQSKKMAGSMMASMKYMTDPAVQKANARLFKAMASFAN